MSAVNTWRFDRMPGMRRIIRNRNHLTRRESHETDLRAF